MASRDKTPTTSVFTFPLATCSDESIEAASQELRPPTARPAAIMVRGRPRPPVPPKDLDNITACLEDSTYELVSNASVISEDEATTASIESRSISGDTADDFSSFEVSDGSEAEDEDEEELEDMSASVVEARDREEDEETPALMSQATFSQGSIADSNLTARPEDVVKQRRVFKADEELLDSDSEDEALSTEPCRQSTTARARRLSDGVDAIKQQIEVHTLNLVKLVRNSWAGFEQTPLGQQAAALPWMRLVVSGLIMLSISASYLAMTATSASRAGLQAAMEQQAQTLQVYNTKSTIAAPPSGNAFDGFFGRIKQAGNASSVPVVKKPTKPKAVNTNSGSLGSVIPADKSYGPDMDYRKRDPGAFNIVREGSDLNYMILAPASVAFRDPQIVMTATRKDLPVRHKFIKLRRGVYQLKFAQEDAFGTVEISVRTKNAPHKGIRQTLHLRPTWRDLANELPAQIGSVPYQIGEAAADAASKVAEAIRTDLLVPAEMATKQLGVYVKNSFMPGPRNDSKATKNTRTQAAVSNKNLMAVPQIALDELIKAQHELMAAQKRLAKQLTRNSACVVCSIKKSAVMVYDNMAHLTHKVSSKTARKLRKLDVTMPIGQSKSALKRAQKNAKGFVGQVHKKVEHAKKDVKRQLKVRRKERKVAQKGRKGRLGRK